MKKNLTTLVLVLAVSFSLGFFYRYSNVFAEEIESDVTVKILHDDTVEAESSKEKDSIKDSDKQNEVDDNIESKIKGKLPKTNEFINPFNLVIGMLILVTGLIGLYINNKRNGANKNEKN